MVDRLVVIRGRHRDGHGGEHVCEQVDREPVGADALVGQHRGSAHRSTVDHHDAQTGLPGGVQHRLGQRVRLVTDQHCADVLALG